MERPICNVPVLTSVLLFLYTSQVLAYDFDGDNRDDLALYNPSTAIFDIRSSQTGKHQTAQVGTKGDVPCPLDWNGDGKDDPATYNRTTGVFSINVNGKLQTRPFGLPGDIPVNGKYRKTACDDLAVYRPFDGSWWVLRCDGKGSIRYTATANEFPVPADYDGDGREDRITWNAQTGVWHIRRSSTGKKSTVQFGLPGDIPLARDFFGDGKADLAVFRPLAVDQLGFRKTAFYVRQPSAPASPLVFPWGNWGSVPELLDVSGTPRLICQFSNTYWAPFTYAPQHWWTS